MRLRLESASTRWPSLGWPGIAALVWLGLVAVAELLRSRVTDPPPLCQLRRWTDIECPTCGTTRAVKALAQGDPLAALFFNPLMTLLLLYGVFWVVVRVGARRQVILELPPGLRRWTLAIILLTLALNWAWVLVRG